VLFFCLFLLCNHRLSYPFRRHIARDDRVVDAGRLVLPKHLCYSSIVGVQRFTRINPARNDRRWYVVAWGPTLFGDWAVTRAWGRLGSGWSQRRVQEFPTADQARAEVEAQAGRRERRGYVVSR